MCGQKILISFWMVLALLINETLLTKAAHPKDEFGESPVKDSTMDVLQKESRKEVEES